jgi:hypothetical protein
VCIGEATGAGGANVWDSDDLRVALHAAGRPLPQLPKGVRFTVAVRRAVRTGDAEGTLIEDVGVPGQRYDMTRDDLFRGNHDLIERCYELLEAQPYTRLEVSKRRGVLTANTIGLDQLDLYVAGHPAAPPFAVGSPRATTRIPLPAGAREIEVVGFSGGVVRQRRRL